MRYWWVNLKKTYKLEVPGGFMWSPVTKINGARNPFWDNMTKVEPGDLIFAYAQQQIKAIGVVQRKAYPSPKPASFENTPNNWAQIGWLVEVEFNQLTSPIVPKVHLDKLEIYLREKSAPLDQNGNGKERYLLELHIDLAKILLELSEIPIEVLTEELIPIPNDLSDYEIDIEIKLKHLEGDPEGIQLTKSRRGQGIFKNNVRLVEDHCRITGVTNIKHLRASHIKPWSISNKEEKLDGFNGLLLSPHVDHLFDRGFISFRDSGDLLVSSSLSSTVLAKWSIREVQNVGGFKKAQLPYLEYHRDEVFKTGV